MSVSVRVCKKCGEEKPVSCFNVVRKNGKEYRLHSCNSCNNKAQILRQGKAKLAADARARRYARKLRAIEYKGGSCEMCGGIFHPAAFDFHHTNPYTKDLDPGLMMGYKDEKLMAELDKCILLCANCHRIHHYEESRSE